MRQLTQEQRNWRILAYSGAITGYRCRIFSKGLFDKIYWFCAGVISGLVLAVVINQILRSLI